MQLRKTFRFEASHILPRHPGKCHRLHGHSWVLHVYVEGEVNPETGFVLDYALISEAVKPLVEALDHRHLGQWDSDPNDAHLAKLDWLIDLPEENEVPNLPLNFYPSSENLAMWVGTQLKDLNWSKIALEETCTSHCELTRAEFDRSQLK